VRCIASAVRFLVAQDVVHEAPLSRERVRGRAAYVRLALLRAPANLFKIKLSGRLSGNWRSREPARRWRALVCARVLAGQAFYLGLSNLPVIHGKEKVYGSSP
jgi:hypothetical protein